MATQSRPRIAALTLAVSALEVRPGEPLVRIFPAGEFSAPRGAMQGQGPWFMDAGIAAQVIARNASRSTDVVIDYEHQTLLAESNGQPAPASGWVDPRSLVWIGEGDKPGLYGAVRWTARASQMIAAEEYRYLSPVFPYSDTGAVLDLLHIALTNSPGIDAPILAALSARGAYPADPPSEDINVNELLKQLLAALGLPETTTQEAALQGVAALKAKADTLQPLEAEIAALRTAGAGKPDPAKYVPIETMAALQAEVAALRAKGADGEAAQLIEAAIADGQLLEPQREWAAELGKTNIAALRAYIEKTPKIAALRGMQTTTAKPENEQKSALGAAEVAVCKALGLSADEYAKAGKEAV